MTTDRCTKDTIEDQVYNKSKNWNMFYKNYKKNKVIQAMKTQNASPVSFLQPAAFNRLYNVHKL